MKFIDCFRRKPELRDYFSPEKDIIKEKFNNIPYMDVWISSIIEGYIYEKIIKVDKQGTKEEYIERYGKMEGEYKEWYPEGQLEVQRYYKDGKREGECKWWWDNGQLRSQEYYKGGKFDGEWKRWYANGQLWVQLYYKEGKLNGEYKWWLENGQLMYQYYYKEGKLEGEIKEWNEHGDLILYRIYTRGEVIDDLQRTLLPVLTEGAHELKASSAASDEVAMGPQLPTPN